MSPVDTLPTEQALPCGGSRTDVTFRSRITALVSGVVLACGAAATGSAVPAGAAGAVPSADEPPVRVVVTGAGAVSAAGAVERAGGRVTSRLPLIGGVVAELPAGARLPAGLRVTEDRPVTFASAAPSPSVASSTVRATIGLPPDGDDGHGVTVALVDTGVTEVGDLAGRIVGHVDVTGTADGAVRDGHGHGTFTAGLIAGTGATSAGAHRGVAPGARILDVRVARPDGTTDLSSVLQGLQAVADRERRDRIRVVNLSLASGSPVPYQLDPLNRALRGLWRRGMTVVVAAGNGGPADGTVSAPGNDPVLLTAGGLDENGTPLRDDDIVPEWSARGPTRQGVTKPDLVAPAASVIGLRTPGSVIDTAYPQARVGEAYLRGSGTSMATAVVSGAAAALVAENPRLRPDDVKALLAGNAYRVPGLADPHAAGSGGLDLAAALAAAGSYRGRGATAEGPVPGNPATWRALAAGIEAGDAAAAARAWRALDPAARSWAARSWAGLDTPARAWAARSWAARSWAGREGADAEEWAARSWAARSWAADDWAARSWAARSWAARSWAARSWAADDWAARSWAGDVWSARSWTARW
ncbi:MAG: S8 family serine peptidase [Actinomycetales bacterium]|nr:S8 family serine peptidase [Actinomycetales bacterium]